MSFENASSTSDSMSVWKVEGCCFGFDRIFEPCQILYLDSGVSIRERETDYLFLVWSGFLSCAHFKSMADKSLLLFLSFCLILCSFFLDSKRALGLQWKTG